MIRRPLKPAPQRQRELAAGGDVDARPSSSNTRRTAVHGNALEANTTSPSPIAALNSRARGPQVVLGDRVQRRAELPRQFGGVAAADAQAAVIDAEARGYRWLAVAGTAREV